MMAGVDPLFATLINHGDRADHVHLFGMFCPLLVLAICCFGAVADRVSEDRHPDWADDRLFNRGLEFISPVCLDRVNSYLGNLAISGR